MRGFFQTDGLRAELPRCSLGRCPAACQPLPDFRQALECVFARFIFLRTVNLHCSVFRFGRCAVRRTFATTRVPFWHWASAPARRSARSGSRPKSASGRRLREQLGSLLEALRFGVPLCGEVTLGDSHTRHLAYEQARPVGEFPFTAEDLRRTKNESAFADYSIYCQSSGTFMAERASDSGEGFRVGDGPAFLPRSPPPSPSPPNTDCDSDSASECARARAAACAHRAQCSHHAGLVRETC